MPDVPVLFLTEKLEGIESRLAECNAAIDKLRAYGASWALDCREMRINECNRDDLWKERNDIKDAIEWYCKEVLKPEELEELGEGMLAESVACWEHLIGEEMI
jgi:hypothetical protein